MPESGCQMSWGLLEIFVNRGNARELLGIGEGDPVEALVESI